MAVKKKENAWCGKEQQSESNNNNVIDHLYCLNILLSKFNFLIDRAIFLTSKIFLQLLGDEIGIKICLINKTSSYRSTGNVFSRPQESLKGQ